jgi:hypothetical protein
LAIHVANGDHRFADHRVLIGGGKLQDVRNKSSKSKLFLRIVLR